MNIVKKLIKKCKPDIKIFLKRGLKDSDYIPEDGETVWAKDTREFIVGDGKHQVRELSGLTNVTNSPNGKLWTVEVDDEGNATAIPFVLNARETNPNRAKILREFFQIKCNDSFEHYDEFYIDPDLNEKKEG